MAKIRIPVEQLLTPAERRVFEERATLLELFSLLPRAAAEKVAYEEILKRRAAPPDQFWAVAA